MALQTYSFRRECTLKYSADLYQVGGALVLSIALTCAPFASSFATCSTAYP